MITFEEACDAMIKQIMRAAAAEKHVADLKVIIKSLEDKIEWLEKK